MKKTHQQLYEEAIGKPSDEIETEGFWPNIIAWGIVLFVIVSAIAFWIHIFKQS